MVCEYIIIIIAISCSDSAKNGRNHIENHDSSVLVLKILQ